jgi:simple sugar transport system substrate-binding protein
MLNKKILGGNIMKKVLRSLSLVLIFTFVAGLMAVTSAAGAKKLTVGFAQIGAESAWRTAETNSVKAAAGVAGVKLKFSDAQQKQENQIKALRSFIAQKVDVIALAPVVDSGWDAVLKEAKKAKIPVILVDRSIKTADPSLYATFIGSDFFLEGVNACKQLAKAMGNKGNIVELQGTVGSSAAVERQKGFAAELKNHPDMKIIKTQSGDFTRAGGQQVMEAFLKSDGDNIQGLYAHNDDMALGAIQAIEAAGKKPAVDIKIVSIDGVKGIFEAMVAGKANCTVECNPLLGPQIFQAAKDLAAGKTLPKWIKSKETFYTADQAKAALPTRKY